jgi:adenylosuccinate lyase
MNLDQLSAISPIDGRYRDQTETLSTYFSEYALIKWRVYVEIQYFCELLNLKIISNDLLDEELVYKLKNIYNCFDKEDAQIIKKLEKTLNHDVKAVEYFVKQKVESIGLGKYKEFVHFGLTSQDINNTAIPLMVRKWFQNIYIVDLEKLIDSLEDLSELTKNQVMLARTHGQPASPTKMGKEIKVFIERLNNQKKQLLNLKFYGKFGGATGNFNAHHVSYPNINWEEFSNNLLSSMGLVRYQYTTQIEHYDNLGQFFDFIKRINTILIDFSRDMWQYISMDYFNQKISDNEVGSSAMPHKINPIDFENAEGNLGMANAILSHLSDKLPISRLQRDLTDSTVLRNIGVPMSHIKISLNSLTKGIKKLTLNEIQINSDLNSNWMVISEGIQTVLRRENYPKPYEKLKELTRTNTKIDKQTIDKFIDDLDISIEIKTELKSITPHNYCGIY